ncbi:MAG: hypothetical protein PHP30_00870 [Bacteroidales bacterium]|nr:hypothetical protein [Bacteroidales bacterium]MDD3988638.1 hypothetical protein [Bacteroidales bacterium]
MATELPSRQQEILDNLNKKAHIKLKVFNQTMEVFNQIKEILNEMSNDLNDLLDNTNDRRVRLEYRDRGKFEAEFKFADDVLIFSMHSDIFQFDREHPVWKSDFLKEDPANSYCGIIRIYNFLSDSLKYNREQDLGYLVARIFVNRDKFFLVEGKRQKNKAVSTFGKKQLGREELLSIIETSVLYAMSFDLLIPPYDLVKVASVEQMNDKIESAKLQTGKRMGYKYNSDDVLDF